MKKNYIFIPLYRSFALRYLLATGIIKKISKTSTIVAFVDKKKLKIYKKIFRNYNIIFEDLHIEKISKIKYHRIYNFLRLIKTFTYGENKNLKNNSINLAKIKFKNELKGIYFLIKPISFILRNFVFLRRVLFLLENYFDHKKIFTKYFNKYNPKALIVTSYGYNFDQYFVRECKKFNCKSISIIYSWDNPSTKGYKSSDSDHYIVWNNTMKKEIEVFQDVPSYKLHVCGIAHWDTYFKDLDKKKYFKNTFYKQNNISFNKKIILFFSSGPRDFKNGYQIIDKLCNFCKQNKKFFLIARMHPLYLDDNLAKKYLGKSNVYFESELKKKYKEVLLFKNPSLKKFGSEISEAIYPAKDLLELKKLYSSAEIFINEYSTTMLEACIFDIPTINVAIGNYRNTNLPVKTYNMHHHLKVVNSFNAFDEIDNFKDLEKKIYEINLKKNTKLLLRKKIVKNFLSQNSGNASNKIFEEIKKIIS
jgi:hypothetical protein